MKKKTLKPFQLHKINISYLENIKAGNGGDEDGGAAGEEPPKFSLLCITRTCSFNFPC
jgi:hypothetical protein